MKKSLAEKFWKKIDIRKSSKCWNWVGAIQNCGYGVIGDGRYGIVTTHRLSWEIHYGEIKDNLNVLHKCDNKRCVNPNHLYLGNHSDNMSDRMSRNPGNLGGGHQKIDNDDRMNIVSMYRSGNFLQRELSDMFGISRPYVSMLVNNRARINIDKN